MTFPGVFKQFFQFLHLLTKGEKLEASEEFLDNKSGKPIAFLDSLRH